MLAGIQKSIARLNDSGRYSFKLSTSIGNSKYKATEIEDLSVLIDLADQDMYQKKRQKKKMQAKENV